MAKVLNGGILTGKVDGRVNYYSQNGGYLSRSQNPAMSGRVKTDPAFANTRLNASEFGAAGKAAGAIVRPVSQRWRYILNPIATGELAKVILEGIKADTQNPWGERTITLDHMANVQEKYNQLSKNDMPQLIVSGIDTGEINAAGTSFRITDSDVEMDADFVSTLLAKGAEGVIVNAYSFGVSAPIYQPATGKYELIRRTCRLTLLDSIDNEIADGNTLVSSDSHSCNLLSGAIPPMNTTTASGVSGYFGGVLIIMLPYKVVSNEKYILQEHCAAYWKSLQQAED